MRCMFFYCSSLKELNIDNISIYKETNINYMFSLCSDELKNNILSQKKIGNEAFKKINNSKQK